MTFDLNLKGTRHPQRSFALGTTGNDLNGVRGGGKSLGRISLKSEYICIYIYVHTYRHLAFEDLL